MKFRPRLIVSSSCHWYCIVATHPPACIIIWLSTVYHLRIYSKGYPLQPALTNPQTTDFAQATTTDELGPYQDVLCAFYQGYCISNPIILTNANLFCSTKKASKPGPSRSNRGWFSYHAPIPFPYFWTIGRNTSFSRYIFECTKTSFPPLVSSLTRLLAAESKAT